MGKKKANGRPSLYKAKYCKDIVKYFQRDQTREVLEEHYDGRTGRIIETTKTVSNPPPTLYGFAASIGVCRDTLNEWASVHPKFSVAMGVIKAYQADFIVGNTMTGLSPASFAKFMMGNNHGWVEKQVLDQNIKEIKVTINKDDVDL